MSHGAGLVRTTCSSGSAPGAGAGAGPLGLSSLENLLDPIYPRTHGAILKVAQMFSQLSPEHPDPAEPLVEDHPGHAADRLHLREDLFVDQLQRLQLLRSGHHLQLDHDPRLLSGAPLPPLPSAHLHQLAPVGTPALFNRYPAPPHRLHRGSFRELQTERTGGWSDLRFPGHLPLPGERVAVLQDLVRDPVHRRRLTPPGPPSPVGGPAGL